MATVTHVRSTGVTTNSSQYATTNVNCTVNELAIVFTGAEGTAAIPTCVDNKGGTYTLSTNRTGGGTGGLGAWFVADQLCTTSSMTVTIGYSSGDPATGMNISIYSVAGLSTSRLGLNAVKQRVSATGVGSSTPAVTFAASVSSSNPTIGFVCNVTNPATIAPPASWTEGADFGHATPNNGMESVFRNDTFNGTVVTWGGTSPSAFIVFMAEMDTSTMAGGAAGGFPGRRTLMGVGRV